MMASRAVAFNDLTGREIDAWHSLREANPALDSPYFDPAFARAVNDSGRPVTVIVSGCVDRVEAMMPVHCDGSVLRPVGWPGSDFQGPILAFGTPYSPMRLLSGRGKAFAFDHLLEPCPGFDPWVESRRSSPYIDVTGGLDGYRGRASRTGKDNLGQARRRAAKAEREYGPLRFVASSRDPMLLAQVIGLKRAQYAATGAKDFFAEPDRRDLIESLLQVTGTEFGGLLSAVYAGEHLLAAHFGLRSGGVLHWWFPVYDPAFSYLAPGWVLLRELISAAPGLGITRIDLGRGDDEYKRRAKTGESTVCQGLVTKSRVRQRLRVVRRTTTHALKSSPLGPRVQELARVVRSKKYAAAEINKK